MVDRVEENSSGGGGSLISGLAGLFHLKLCWGWNVWGVLIIYCIRGMRKTTFWGGGGEKIRIARMISIWENKGDRKNFDKLFKGGVKYDKLLGAARKIQLAFEEN